MKIERTRIDGEPVRRFTLIAEVTFRDRASNPPPYNQNYYTDDELKGLIVWWMAGALEDRDDGPAVTFREMPEDVS